MPLVIIIGGTGVLANATRHIVASHKDTLLIARRPQALAQELNANYLSLNWTDRAAVADAVTALKGQSQPKLLVTWLHQDGVWLLPQFEGLLAAGGRSLRIHGSSAGDPSQGISTDPPAPAHITRQNIVLGWMATTTGKRWLKDEEICQGVLKAFKQPELTASTVGQIS